MLLSSIYQCKYVCVNKMEKPTFCQMFPEESVQRTPPPAAILDTSCISLLTRRLFWTRCWSDLLISSAISNRTITSKNSSPAPTCFHNFCRSSRKSAVKQNSDSSNKKAWDQDAPCPASAPHPFRSPSSQIWIYWSKMYQTPACGSHWERRGLHLRPSAGWRQVLRHNVFDTW